jgi:hypothetical protein
MPRRPRQLTARGESPATSKRVSARIRGSRHHQDRRDFPTTSKRNPETAGQGRGSRPVFGDSAKAFATRHPDAHDDRPLCPTRKLSVSVSSAPA